jgi:hypothetical protein
MVAMTAPASPFPLFSDVSAHAPFVNAPSVNTVSANAVPRLQYLSIAGELLLLDIRPVERMIMGFVLALEKANRRCFASNAYFAKLCNVSSSTTQRAVRRLVNRGLLRHHLLHHSGTQRLLSINTAHLEQEIGTALAYASTQALAGQPPKTMLAPDLRPKNESGANATTTDSKHDSLPPPMTLEEEYLYRQMEKDLLYCRDMGANVAAVVHHLEGQQVQALERVQQLVQTLVQEQMVAQEQVRVVEEQQQSSIKLSPSEPVSGDVCPAIQPMISPAQKTPRQNDEPPQHCDDAPRHFDDPIYTQFHSQRSLYKKEPSEENFDSSGKTPDNGNEKEHCFPVGEETAAGEQGALHLNALQTTLSTLQTRANERRKAAAHTSPLPTQQTSQHGRTQQPYPKYSKPQTKTYVTSHTPPQGKPQKPQTFYQKQGQQNDEARRGIMTFQELPHGAMFTWEGSGNVYGMLRKLDDDHALRLENNRIIRVGNLQGRVEVQRR